MKPSALFERWTPIERGWWIQIQARTLANRRPRPYVRLRSAKSSSFDPASRRYFRRAPGCPSRAQGPRQPERFLSHLREIKGHHEDRTGRSTY